ncbi:glycosyltransferase family 39 protein [bacterium]|nr:glycosyltransferase family 39 protein [candidate division CSSED10-310 bacterium]
MSNNSCRISQSRYNAPSARYIAGLSIVLIIAAYLRFRHVHARGLWYWDEGLFIMGARFVRWRADWIFKGLIHFFDTRFVLPSIAAYQGYPVFLQKPVHVLLLSVFSLFFRNDCDAAISYSICFGLLTILLTAELGRRWFNPAAGLIAALWLAFQPSHVHYSRLALHEMDSMALFLMVMLFHHTNRAQLTSTRAQMGRGCLIGALAILTIGASYRYMPYIVLMLIFEIAATFRSERPCRQSSARWLGISTGALICFLMLNQWYHLAFFPDFTWSEPSSYLDVLKTKFLGDESSFDLDHPFYYFKILTSFDGFLPTVFWSLTITCLLISRSPPDIRLAAWFLVPMTIFSLTTTRVPRTVTGLYPFIALAIGRCTTLSLTRFQPFRRKVVAWMTIGLLVVSVCVMAIRLPSVWIVSSGYPEMVRWLTRQTDSRHFSTMYPIYAVYQGKEFVYPVPFTMEEIQREVERTRIRYLTVDWQKFLRYSQGVYEIEKAVLPVFAVHHDPGIFFASLYENHLPDDVPMLQEDKTLQYIKVYDLYKALPAMGYRLSFLEDMNE